MKMNSRDIRFYGTAKGIVDRVQVSFVAGGDNFHPFYLYYTTVSTLSRMLDNGFLRLSNIRSPSINDLLEPREFGDKGYWDRICIGCFSADRMESNAMWSVYGRPKEEAIIIRIPCATMKKLVYGDLFVDRKCSSRKTDVKCVLDCDGEMTLVNDHVERHFHDVLYFQNIRLDEGDDYDKEGGRNAVLNLYRDYQVIASLRIHGTEPKTLDSLAGYVKRWSWMYERESRVRIVLPKEYAKSTAYLKLPTDFFEKVSIILGPDFDRNHPLARTTLKSFLDRCGVRRNGREPLIESAYREILNLNRANVRNAPKPIRMIYKGKIVNRQSPQSQSLYERYLRLVNEE